ncbi:MAG: DUF1499 domain-containing protein [Litorimonas sp.]
MIFLYIIGAIFILFVILGLISQKGEAPGLIEGKLAEPGSKPNTVCSETGTQSERAVAPIQGPLSDVADAIEATGGTITARSDDYLSATYMSRLFKFVDDVEVRQDGDVCQIRSGSRVGYSDRGVNRKRVETIRHAVQSHITS